MDFFMNYIFLPFTALAVLFLTVALGAMPASAVAGGRKGVVWATLLTMAFIGALYAGFGYMLWDVAFYRSSDWPPSAGAYIGFALAVVCIAICPIHTLLTGSSRAQFLRDMAPRVQPFIERHFATIDQDGDGVISEADLKQPLSSLGLDSEEMAMLQHIKDELSEIGHVIDSYTTTTWIWISVGKGGYMSPVTTTHNVYGISADDLPSYTARVVEKYKHW
jgi:hypothetical protein